MIALSTLVLAATLSAAPTLTTPAGTVIVPPRITTMSRPDYPESALRAGLAGCAWVAFEVAADGAARNIRVLTSLPSAEFGASAARALSGWRFTATGRSVAAQRLFLFNPSNNALDYDGPDCGAPAGTPSIYALAAEAVPQPPPPPPRPRPANLPERVELDITRPPIVQTVGSVYANNAIAPAGQVTLRFCVNEQGHTENIEVTDAVRGDLYKRVALNYIRAAQFEPHTIQGFPVTACGITQTFVFRPAQK